MKSYDEMKEIRGQIYLSKSHGLNGRAYVKAYDVKYSYYTDDFVTFRSSAAYYSLNNSPHHIYLGECPEDLEYVKMLSRMG